MLTPKERSSFGTHVSNSAASIRLDTELTQVISILRHSGTADARWVSDLISLGVETNTQQQKTHLHHYVIERTTNTAAEATVKATVANEGIFLFIY